jgi:FkbM family methyltransferase
MSGLISRAIDRAVGAVAAKVAPVLSEKLGPLLRAELTKLSDGLHNEVHRGLNNSSNSPSAQMIDPLKVIDPNFSGRLRDKDAIMREVFYGFVKATRPDIICDVGCFSGEDAIRFSAIAPESRLYAFEANSDNIVRYINNRPGLERVTIEYAAVCEVDGEVSFHVLEATGGAEDWRRAASSLNNRANNVPSVSVIVPSVRLDTYFKNEIDTDSTFILWIDVEGALDRVFAGAEKVLSQTILFRAEVERQEFWIGQKLAKEIISMAEDMGFVLLCDSWTPEEHAQSDVLMVNRNWLDLAINSAKNPKKPT